MEFVEDSITGVIEFWWWLLLLFTTDEVVVMTAMGCAPSTSKCKGGGGGGGRIPIVLGLTAFTMSALMSLTVVAVVPSAVGFGIGMSTRHIVLLPFATLALPEDWVLLSSGFIESIVSTELVAVPTVLLSPSFLSISSCRTLLRLCLSLTSSAKRLVSLILLLKSL